MRYLALDGIYRCFLSRYVHSSSLDDARIGKARRYLEFCIAFAFQATFYTQSLP